MENTKDFLNPSSMLTPGVAGAMSMAIANTFASQFDLIHPWPATLALIFSFLFGLLVIAAKSMPYWQRFIYYVLNSFIIFTVAVGSNTLGQAGAGSSAGEAIASHIELLTPLVSSVIPTAHAQSPSTNGWCCLNGRINPSLQEECNKWGGWFFSTQEEAQRACHSEESKRREKDSRFFRPWF